MTKLTLLPTLLLLACSSPTVPPTTRADSGSGVSNTVTNSAPGTTGETTGNNGATAGDVPRVVSVSAGGAASAYTFSVALETADTGCDHYADWWEVVAEDGSLLYRRILAHSHVEEQPFSRSGGPVAIDAEQQIRIRLHMNTTGYSQQGMEGSVAGGFVAVELANDFAAGLLSEEPLPSGCAF